MLNTKILRASNVPMPCHDQGVPTCTKSAAGLHAAGTSQAGDRGAGVAFKPEVDLVHCGGGGIATCLRTFTSTLRPQRHGLAVICIPTGPLHRSSDAGEPESCTPGCLCAFLLLPMLPRDVFDLCSETTENMIL